MARLVGYLTNKLITVHGAGLAMATNDTIDLLYGKSANFLHIGHKATPETIKEAFRLVLRNHNVPPPRKRLLKTDKSHPSEYLRRLVPLFRLNVVIIQGDIIARGIIAAMEALHVPVPVVARIQGTKRALGIQMVQIMLNLIDVSSQIPASAISMSKGICTRQCD